MRCTRTGFSLLELLVVLSVVTLLLSVLLPSLGAARDAGRAIQCLSNLRQMGIAAAAYQQVYDGYFPPAYNDADTTWELSMVNGKHMPGTLWQGQGVVAIQQCPSFDGPDSWSSAPFSGYNYNTSYIGRGAAEGPPVRVDDVRSADRCAIFGDGEWIGGANKLMRSPLPHDGDTSSDMMRAAGAQGFRHREATNVVYADGHGSSQLERFTAGNPHVAPGTGFLSDDNSAYDLD